VWCGPRAIWAGGRQQQSCDAIDMMSELDSYAHAHASHHMWQKRVKRHWCTCMMHLAHAFAYAQGTCAGRRLRTGSPASLTQGPEEAMQVPGCGGGRAVLSRTAQGREELSATGATQRRHRWGCAPGVPRCRQACRAMPVGRDNLAMAGGAPLGLLCSAARHAPCAWHASPAELTYTRLCTVQLVNVPQRAGCP
jgi:hypothetical protein